MREENKEEKRKKEHLKTFRSFLPSFLLQTMSLHHTIYLDETKHQKQHNDIVVSQDKTRQGKARPV